MSHSTAKDYAKLYDPAMMFLDQQNKTNSIRNLSHNTRKYTKALTIIESRFVETLVENETLSSLASFDKEPDNGHQPNPLILSVVSTTVIDRIVGPEPSTVLIEYS